MKPGNACQWHYGDPKDLELESVEEPKPRRIPTCPSDIIAGESIGASPNIFNTRQMTSSIKHGSRIGAVNLSLRYEQNKPDGQVRVSNPWGSFTHPAPPRDDDDDVDLDMPPLLTRGLTRSNSDSSNDSRARSKTVRKKGHPFLPPLTKYMSGEGAGPDNMVRRKGHPFLLPMAKYMKGGVDAADTRQPKTDREIFAKAMASFKCKVGIKGYDPFTNEAKWIHWWSQFRITLFSQGLNPVLDLTYTPDKPMKESDLRGCKQRYLASSRPRFKLTWGR
jgi:hypothetical protein